MKKRNAKVDITTLLDDLLSLLNIDDENSEVSIEDNLLGNVKKTIKDILKDEDRKEAEENFKKQLQVVSDSMNKKAEASTEKVRKNERKVLIDTPIKCDKKCECEKHKTPHDTQKLDVYNAVSASDVRSGKAIQNLYREIDEDLTAELILMDIYDEIVHCCENITELTYNFLYEDWYDLLEGVSDKTLCLLIDKICNHLHTYGYECTKTIKYERGKINYLKLIVSW